MARHKHTLSNYRLLTGNMGLLYPIGLTEVLPGDAFQHSTNVFMRFSPMAAPIMHPITVRVHHFFVPHRLTWKEAENGGWEEFITGGPNLTNAAAIPKVTTTGNAGDLFDYFGVPPVSGLEISALPIRAYNMIYNEFYRDQDLVTLVGEDGPIVKRIAWQKDYFTDARPWAQKGPSVTLPLGDSAPVKGIGMLTTASLPWNDALVEVKEAGGAGTADMTYLTATDLGTAAHMYAEEDQDNPGYPNIFADLSLAEGVDINEFRRAFALQRFAEARARYGSRYTEYLRYLGVRPADARLQRPEYLGGGKARVSTSEVLQTANETGAELDRFGVGDLYGHGVASMRSNAYRRQFDEHGYCITLLSVRPKAIYQQSTPRTFLRRNKEDFWQKELEQIGQQEIWGGEVYAETADTDTELYATFGYQDRYREYKEEASRVCGEYRTLLNYWHLARDFGTRPALNQTFTDCVPSDRIFNVQDQHKLRIAAQHHLVARRLVRKSGASKIL